MRGSPIEVTHLHYASEVTVSQIVKQEQRSGRTGKEVDSEKEVGGVGERESKDSLHSGNSVERVVGGRHDCLRT